MAQQQFSHAWWIVLFCKNLEVTLEAVCMDTMSHLQCFIFPVSFSFAIFVSGVTDQHMRSCFRLKRFSLRSASSSSQCMAEITPPSRSSGITCKDVYIKQVMPKSGLTARKWINCFSAAMVASAMGCRSILWTDNLPLAASVASRFPAGGQDA